MLIVAAVAVVGGLVLLTKAADEFVVGAARLAVALRVSSVVIGAVVVGFGTSAPEMLVSGIASFQGKLDIAVGNIIGSNVANLTLILGAAALICAVGVASETLRREAPLSAGAVILFALLVQGGLYRWEGAILAVAMAAALWWMLRSARTAPGEDVAEFDAEVAEFVDAEHPHRTPVEVARTVAGLVGTLIGAQILVWGASEIADAAGLSQGFIGLTLVALGTSLPELTTAVAAARRGEVDLIVGNLLGSNIFNSLAVAGIGALAARPGTFDIDGETVRVGAHELIDPGVLGWPVVLMVVVALGAVLFMVTGKRVVRTEAVALLAVYVVAVPLLAR